MSIFCFSISFSFSVKAETTIYATHDSTSGSYVDYMKTVYARAGKPEIMMLSLTSFDKELNEVDIVFIELVKESFNLANSSLLLSSSFFFF